MQYCSFVAKGEDRTVLPGRVLGEIIEELDAPSLIDVIRNGGKADSVDSHRADEVRLVAPVQHPSKIVCIGLNYRKHIDELGHEFPTEPVLFSKPSTAVIGPNDRIVLPSASKQVDYEGEVAIVIGKEASKVEDAAPYIFGYTCFNDVTARDIQKRSPDWTRAKGFDTFAPMGPVISTDKPSWLRTFLNEEQKQYSLTSDMIFGFDELIRNISQVMTLKPGDIIATGTPFGVGKLKDGDRIVVEADGIGRLENSVVDTITVTSQRK